MSEIKPIYHTVLRCFRTANSELACRLSQFMMQTRNNLGKCVEIALGNKRKVETLPSSCLLGNGVNCIKLKIDFEIEFFTFFSIDSD